MRSWQIQSVLVVAAESRITSNQINGADGPKPVFAKSLINVDIAVDAEATNRVANCCEGIL